MPLTWICLGACACFLVAYLTYSRFIARHFTLSNQTPTPAVTHNDGEDFIPAKASLLLSQHFSAIAAAGPIVGPILAGVWFGWLPALLWIVLGAIFFGAVHDFSSLIGSVRHEGRSIAEVIGEQMGRRAYLLFLVFIWLSLVYVITAFADITSASFVEPEFGGGVATSSVLYLLLAIAMGFLLRSGRIRLRTATLIFIPLVLGAIACGQLIPIHMPMIGSLRPQVVWNLILLIYCFVASVTPMWALLQPRGYLGGFFLYGVLGVGVAGIFLGGMDVQYPAFIGWTALNGMPLFPMLFVTVACGACSGFHGLVSSGTTSKQIAQESDTRLVGYGGMLLEGLVAVIALATVMMLAPGDPLTKAQPDRIYATGLSRFVEVLGISREMAMSFTLLAFATFIYDTLDVSTRLCRYILQELLGWEGSRGKYLATFLSLLLPGFFVSITLTDAAGNVIPAWRMFWTIFGTSNQLLAGLTLLGMTLWLKRLGKPIWITAIPAGLMMGVTLWSLVVVMKTRFSTSGTDPIGWIALLLTALAVLLLTQIKRKPHTA
jgi:carbon starvation protein